MITQIGKLCNHLSTLNVFWWRFTNEKYWDGRRSFLTVVSASVSQDWRRLLFFSLSPFSVLTISFLFSSLECVCFFILNLTNMETIGVVGECVCAHAHFKHQGEKASGNNSQCAFFSFFFSCYHLSLFKLNEYIK